MKELDAVWQKVFKKDKIPSAASRVSRLTACLEDFENEITSPELRYSNLKGEKTCLKLIKNSYYSKFSPFGVGALITKLNGLFTSKKPDFDSGRAAACRGGSARLENRL